MFQPSLARLCPEAPTDPGFEKAGLNSKRRHAAKTKCCPDFSLQTSEQSLLVT